MTRHDDTTDDRTSRTANFHAIFQALLGSGPPDGARERMDQVRTIMTARDDDAALGLVAVYEVYLALAHRRMRAAARKAAAALALAQLLIIGMAGCAIIWVVGYASDQNRATLSATVAAAARQTCDAVYGESIMQIADYFKGNRSQALIASASSKLSPDEVSRLAQMPDLKDRLAALARLNADQWRVVLSVSASEKSMRSR